MTTQPQPGQYWQTRDTKQRAYVHGVTKLGIVLIETPSGAWVGIGVNQWLEDWQHLPDCDSFDWVPPSQPDPGEGWRLIDKAVDVPRAGDEYWDEEFREWTPRALWLAPFERYATYRRRIEPPTPRTRTVVLREWVVWSKGGNEILQWHAGSPIGWFGRYPTGETRTIEVPE
jgi:hypothetical protein